MRHINWPHDYVAGTSSRLHLFFLLLLGQLLAVDAGIFEAWLRRIVSVQTACLLAVVNCAQFNDFRSESTVLQLALSLLLLDLALSLLLFGLAWSLRLLKL